MKSNGVLGWLYQPLARAAEKRVRQDRMADAIQDKFEWRRQNKIQQIAKTNGISLEAASQRLEGMIQALMDQGMTRDEAHQALGFLAPSREAVIN